MGSWIQGCQHGHRDVPLGPGPGQGHHNGDDITDSTDVFDKRNGCVIDTSIPKFEPGVTGYVYANTLVDDPTGTTSTSQ